MTTFQERFDTAVLLDDEADDSRGHLIEGVVWVVRDTDST